MARFLQSSSAMRAGLIRAFVQRLAQFARGEIGELHPRRMTFFLANLLPRFALGYTRTALLRLGGVRIAERSRVNGRFELTGPVDFSTRLVSIGTNTLISGPLHIDLGAPVRIGNNVRIGHSVSLHTLAHDIGGPELRGASMKGAPIVIEDGVWIGSHVAILPSVRVGRGSVVATGAVVHRDVPPNVLVGGVPARVIRGLPEETRETEGAAPALGEPRERRRGIGIRRPRLRVVKAPAAKLANST